MPFMSRCSYDLLLQFAIKMKRCIKKDQQKDQNGGTECSISRATDGRASCSRRCASLLWAIVIVIKDLYSAT